MKKLRVYIDTSVIGGCLDDEFSLESNQLMEAIKQEKFILLMSDINEGVVTSKSINDATHVADAIISWNFKHIVRLDKMKGYNQINLLNGYGILTIISPLEVTIDEANDN
jgi:hypothetical protein